METPVPEYLAQVLEQCGAHDEGKKADYIPELANADESRLGVALCTIDGVVYSAGDATQEFSIQSISKPFVYALAIEQLGLDAVLKKIDVEPSGEAFNEISLEKGSGRPKNPMINAGAITAHSLVQARSWEQRAILIKEFFEKLARRPLEFDEAVFRSEMDTAHRNLAIGHMLRTVDILETDPRDIVRGYVRQCAIKVTLEDLARMAGVLANGGVCPESGKSLLAPRVVRQVLSVMTSCGMYDAAGDWLSVVGIPAKSGVSGGILGALPGQVGMAAFSPRLDSHGNSARGIRIMERLSRDMGLHLMDGARVGRSVINGQRHEDDGVSVHELQGDIQFAQAELVLRHLQREEPSGEGRVVLDLSRIHRMNDVGRRMLLDGICRLNQDGHQVAVVDPGDMLPEPDTSSGYVPEVYEDLDSALHPR